MGSAGMRGAAANIEGNFVDRWLVVILELVQGYLALFCGDDGIWPLYIH